MVKKTKTSQNNYIAVIIYVKHAANNSMNNLATAGQVLSSVRHVGSLPKFQIVCKERLLKTSYYIRFLNAYDKTKKKVSQKNTKQFLETL